LDWNFKLERRLQTTTLPGAACMAWSRIPPTTHGIQVKILCQNVPDALKPCCSPSFVAGSKFTQMIRHSHICRYSGGYSQSRHAADYLPPAQAFLFRKLNIKGSMAKAMKVTPVLEAARASASKL
jgi:hypothetical protein